MANVAGVLSTKVDFKAGTATCTVDPAKFDAKVAVTALKGAFKDAALKKDAR